MNLPFFISKKIAKANPGSFSSTVNTIAIISIGIGLFIMIISYLILGGFQYTIEKKIFSFSGHVNIIKYTTGNTYEELPMEDKEGNRKALTSIKGVERIQKIAHKAGLLKTKDEVQGVLLKGVDKGFNLEAFQDNIKAGSFITFKEGGTSTEIMISQLLADQLSLKLGDEVVMYFIQNPVRMRKLKIKGIFETSMEEFDRQIIIGDLALIQRLNNWKNNFVGGYEVFLSNTEKTDEIFDQMADELTFEFYLQKVSDKYLQIFEWLKLLNQNVQIFLALILIVACVNMGTVLLILIMERTPMIGLLKALGSTNKQIREIFFYNGFLLIFKGLLVGNLLGIGFGAMQYYFKLIPLDPTNYYMKFVPIAWNWPIIVFLNILVIAIVSSTLIIPTLFIVRVNPVKAIKFD